MSKNFTKTKEDFICEKCGEKVKGTGYTNHCPKCLWSKHVDIKPGDRASSCKGLMKPIDLAKKKGTYIIIHRCEKCGYEKLNKASPNDDIDKIIALSVQNN